MKSELLYPENEPECINILSYFKKSLTSKKYDLLSMFIKDKDTLLFDETTISDDLIVECKKKNKEIILLL